MPEHRVRLVELVHFRAQLDEAPSHIAGHGRDLLLAVRQKLVQRRVEKADCHRQAIELAEDPFEIGLLKRQQLLERLPPARFVARQDHFPDAQDAVLGKEHVLGAA